jgi:HSP90 family molecular chaperone
MTKDQICENLGTIARSGSQAFIKEHEDSSHSVNDSIIGQFGVGFYSSFVVSDDVEVISKTGEGDRGVRWVSDGTG